MDRARELGMGALALTDHGNLYGAIEFYNQAKARNIKPLIGCELYLVETSRLEKHGRSDEGKTLFHLGLLAKNLTGYQNLLKLVSDAHVRGFYYKPRTDFEALARHSDGLMGFTGCLASLIPQHLIHGREDDARRACGRFVDIFGRENYFVELQDHGIPEQRMIAPGLLKLASEFGLKVICTNDVHYVRNTDAGPHDAMLCIQTGAKIEDENRMRFHGQEFYLKSGVEMEKLFGEVPDAVTNTRLVAEMCDLSIPFPKGSERYPRYPLPPEVKTDRAGYLKDLCIAGLKRRYGVDYAAPEAFQDPALAKTLVERLDFELSIIGRTGFIDYFLVVWDFIDWARRHGIPVGPGRGSGAGCLVAYVLWITNLDPLRFKLLFERFLNPERISPPDFDIDFCMRRRGEVIDYVRQKYGNDCVANIITYGTLGAKMVIRDVSRVHNLPFAEADRLAKMVPDELNITLQSAVAKSAEFREEVTKNPVAKRIYDQALVLEGMVRNTGKHAAGIVITDRPLDEFVPLTLQEGDVTVQFDMNAVGKLGLLKMDFLGLKTLTVIADAVDNIRRTVAPDFDIEAVGFEDPKTYALLNTGRTTGVFQLESGGMQNLCRQINLSTIDEIVALIALYRPGPMEWIPDYIRGKKDPSTVTFPHPLLEEVCRETYGVMVYQEQVMEAARVIAGYTLGGADMLRRAMGKKDRDAMADERAKFVEGAKRVNGIDERTSDAIFDILNKFAGYGFNKSHSAAYAVLSYQTGYLKANYPVQFMAAMLSSELGNADKVSHFVAECEAMGLKVLGPDVNESRESFTPVVPATAEKAGLRRLNEGELASRGEGAAAPSLGNTAAALGDGAAVRSVGDAARGEGASTPSVGDAAPPPRAQVAASLVRDAAPPSRPQDATSLVGDAAPPPRSSAIRFGLAGIKGVGEQAAQKIIGERERNGPYRDFHDFLLRVDARAINRRVLENLIATGAFDFCEAPREDLFGQLDEALSALGELQRKYPALRREAPAAARIEEPAESMLFDMAEASAPAAAPPQDVLLREFAEILRHTRRAPAASGTRNGSAAEADHAMLDLGPRGKPRIAEARQPIAAAERTLTAKNRLQFEKELLGFYVSGHPMDAYADLAEAIDTHGIEELPLQSDRIEFRLCGIAGNIVKKLSKRDNRPWAAFTLANRQGSIPLNMFADAFENWGRNLQESAIVLVQGNILVNQEGPRVNVRECHPLDERLPALVRRITWLLEPAHPEAAAFLRELRQTLDSQPGETRVQIGFVFEDRIAPIAETSGALSWRVGAPAFRKLRAHPAVAGVQIETRVLEFKDDRRWKKRG